MHEVPGQGPASAVDAQTALEAPLAALQRAGSVRSYAVHYGPNAIVVTGTGSAVRYLAAWPSVAAIEAYRPGISPAAKTTTVGDAAAREAERQATGSFSGVVTAVEDSSPLSGIRVSTYLQTGPTSWVLLGNTLTLADGSYTFGGLDTGFYRAKFEDPAGDRVPEYFDDRREFFRATVIEVTDTQDTSGIDAALDLAGQISGTVISLNGAEPIADISVSAWYTATGSWHNIGSALTEGDGNYTIGGVISGTVKVRFADIYTPPRYQTEYYDNESSLEAADPVIVTAGAITAGIDAELGGYGQIAGTVVAEDGTTPLADVYADTYEPDGSGGWQWVSYGQTDAAGNYAIGGLLTQDYRVEFSDSFSPAQYATESYNDQPELDSADDIHVELGAVTGGIDATLALTPMAMALDLSTGSNLISLSLSPSDPAPPDALLSITGTYQMVWAYKGCDTSDPWKSYNPSAPPFANDLNAMDEQQGYWLDMTGAAQLQITGVRPVETSIALCAGWNLIGYPAGVERPVTEALAGIDGQYDLVYGYDAADTADPWEKYNPSAPPFANDLETLRPGFGYWIRMLQPATLIIASR
jgi:hypothetical protein